MLKSLFLKCYGRKGTSDLLAWDPLFGPSLDSSSSTSLTSSSSSGKHIYIYLFIFFVTVKECSSYFFLIDLSITCMLYLMIKNLTCPLIILPYKSDFILLLLTYLKDHMDLTIKIHQTPRNNFFSLNIFISRHHSYINAQIIIFIIQLHRCALIQPVHS